MGGFLDQRPAGQFQVMSGIPGAQGLLQAHAGRVGGEQGTAPGLDVLRPLRRVHLQRPIDGAQELRAEAPLARLHRRHQRILRRHLPVQRIGRLLARDQPVQRGSEGVDVGPGTLVAIFVLLDGRVAGRDGDVGLLRGPHRLPGGAEIQQHQRAITAADLDVVGLDVAVQEARRVYHRQAVQQRLQQE